MHARWLSRCERGAINSNCGKLLWLWFIHRTTKLPFNYLQRNFALSPSHIPVLCSRLSFPLFHRSWSASPHDDLMPDRDSTAIYESKRPIYGDNEQCSCKRIMRARRKKRTLDCEAQSTPTFCSYPYMCKYTHMSILYGYHLYRHI